MLCVAAAHNKHTLPNCNTQLSLSLFFLGEEEPSHPTRAALAARLTPRDTLTLCAWQNFNSPKASWTGCFIWGGKIYGKTQKERRTSPNPPALWARTAPSRGAAHSEGLASQLIKPAGWFSNLDNFCSLAPISGLKPSLRAVLILTPDWGESRGNGR